MLPILRIIPIGGVFLAILLLVLALDAPERIHTQWAAPLTPMRGPLISADDHPEWRQLLMRAAVRRAGELARLRNLPDKPVLALPAKKFASLPAARVDADPEPDDTAAAVTAAAPAPATIPIDIGETSLVELPVVMPRERPPIAPVRTRSAKHGHHARPKPPQPPQPFDLFKAMFGDPRMQQQLQQQQLQGQQFQQQRQSPQQPQQQGRRQPQRRLPQQSQQLQQPQPAFGLPATAPVAAAQR